MFARTHHSLSLALCLAFAAQPLYGYPDCTVPKSHEDACKQTATSLKCLSNRECCLVCPGSPCPSATATTAAETRLCQAAVTDRAYEPCGKPTPVIFKYNGTGIDFVKTDVEPQRNTVLLVRNFRLRGWERPEVDCYGTAANAVLSSGPIDTDNNGLLGSHQPKSKGPNHFHFHTFGIRKRGIVNTYMCNFDTNSSTPPLLSPVGFSFRGEGPEGATLTPDALTKHVKEGSDLILRVPSSIQNYLRVWFHESTAVGAVGNGTTVTVNDMQCDKAGMYRIESDYVKDKFSQEIQGFMRVIVTAGTPNSDRCSGGMLLGGECICPPGLIGDSCERACNGSRFGPKCEYELPKPAAQMKGSLLCLPDPYGCGCVPGFSGIDCEQECTPGRWGSECAKECHCEPTSSCSSYNGRCAACAPGYLGDNCQEECPAKLFGIGCQKRCRCDNAAECSHVTGPRTHCRCEDGWLGPTCTIKAVEPAVTVTVTRENPTVAPQARCEFTGVPTPNTTEVHALVNGRKFSFDKITATSNAQLLVTQIRTPPAYVPGRSLNFTCCARTVAGNECATNISFPYELPSLNKAPVVESIGSTTIKLRFNGWSKVTDRGDGPAVNYRACYREKNSTIISYAYSTFDLKDCEACPLIVEKLKSATIYELAVSVQRPGGSEAWGPCGPFTLDLTEKEDKTKATDSLLLKEMKLMQSKLEELARNQRRCCCNNSSG